MNRTRNFSKNWLAISLISPKIYDVEPNGDVAPKSLGQFTAYWQSSEVHQSPPFAFPATRFEQAETIAALLPDVTQPWQAYFATVEHCPYFAAVEILSLHAVVKIYWSLLAVEKHPLASDWKLSFGRYKSTIWE